MVANNQPSPLKLSQPNLGEPQFGSSQGKVHLQAKFRGRTYLSLFCWKEEPFNWSWHFYNRKLDLPFQKEPPHQRARLLGRFLKDSPHERLEEVLKKLRQWTREQKPEQETETEEEELLEAETEAKEIAEEEKRLKKREKSLKGEVAEEVTPFEGHSLIAYFEELNETYFNNEIDIPVTWTRKNFKKLSYGITFGVYLPEKQEIRINARLNQEWIPDYFIKCVLHHEMLHVVTPAKNIDGKTWVHHKEFRQKERQFQDYKKAILWQRANLKKLMKKQKP